MSTLTKVFIGLTSVMAIVLSCLTVAGAARWTKQRETLDAYQQLYQAEFAKRLSLETTMYAQLALKDEEARRAEQTRNEQVAKIRELSDQDTALRTELAGQKTIAAAAEAGRKKLEEILGVQTAELTSAQKQNQELLAQNIDLQTRGQRLSSRNLELTMQVNVGQEENRNLQERLYRSEQHSKELEQASAGGKRTSRAGEPPDGIQAVSAAVVPPIDGEITHVDGNYVSINVGESSGVSSGMEFMIYRGGAYVGDLKVDNVRPKEAGGKITLVKQGQQVQRGDRVSYGMGR